MTVTIGLLEPLVLPRDMVRVVFPVEQASLGNPGLQTLPELLAEVTSRWNYASAPGTPVTVTYAFSAVGPADYEPAYVTDPNHYEAFTAVEIASVETALAAYEAVCGITFERVPAADAQATYRKTSAISVAGVGHFPPSATSDVSAGDAYFDVGTLTNGTYLAFHEIGHTLGLPHAYETYKPIPGDYGAIFENASGRLLSVVDQNWLPKGSFIHLNELGGYSFGYISDPTTPMPLDILALQMLYGANAATNAGDTVYAYDVNPNFFETIWDGGGNDTIDCSNQVNSCLITLLDGSYSTIGLRDPFAGLPQSVTDQYVADEFPNREEDFNDGSNSLAIAFDAIIENAIGGSVADRLIGNDAANRLSGGLGADTLTGGGGNDTLDGGSGYDIMDGGTGDDVFFVNTVLDEVQEVAGAGGGTDTVRASVTETLDANVESLILTGIGNINGTGNAAANTITGNAGKNVLNARGGADTLKGLGGNDILVWAATDSYDGGVGTDTLKVATATLDLRAVLNTRILNVEQVDLRGGVDKTLTVTRTDVLALSSSTDILKVFGDSGDVVNAAGFTQLANSGGFQRFKSGAAILLVETDLNVVI